MKLQPDIIGTIYNNDGTYDDESNVLTEPTPAPGFHVNFTEPVPEFEDYQCYPKTPRRIYAGHDPACYTFSNKQVFDDLYAEVFGNPNNEHEEV